MFGARPRALQEGEVARRTWLQWLTSVGHEGLALIEESSVYLQRARIPLRHRATSSRFF
jgi:hypothetical protein